MQRSQPDQLSMVSKASIVNMVRVQHILLEITHLETRAVFVHSNQNIALESLINVAEVYS